MVLDPGDHVRSNLAFAYRRAIPGLRQDLHYTLRVIRRNPGYAITAMLCLALGIGVNATVFRFLDGIYFRTLPVARADRILAIDRDGSMPVLWRDYLALRGDLHSFTRVAAAVPRETFMDVERSNFGITAEAVSVNYADVLALKPALGRWFTSSDESPAVEPTVVISDGIWNTYFHRHPGAAGKSVRIENQWYRNIGVAPVSFRGVSPPARLTPGSLW